jgi:hypothetical protein
MGSVTDWAREAVMQPYAPFTGVILLPDRAPFGSVSPVSLGDGTPVASIRWHNWSMRARFEILDPDEARILATGGTASVWGRRYELQGPGADTLLELKVSLWGLGVRSTVTLPDGRILSANGNWTSRKFVVTDPVGVPVAMLVNTSRVLSWRPDSLALELTAPVLSVVQAIGLAQCVRAAAESQRRRRAAGS